jgi:hypothetical protein
MHLSLDFCAIQLRIRDIDGVVEDLPDHDPKRPDVGLLRVDQLSQGLWCQPSGGDVLGLRLLELLALSRETEIADLHLFNLLFISNLIISNLLLLRVKTVSSCDVPMNAVVRVEIF